MASCSFPFVLGVALISSGQLLAFNTINYAQYRASTFSNKEPSGVKFEKKMKELQEMFRTEAKSDNDTRENVKAVKNQVEELTKKFEGATRDITETKEQVNEISDNLMKIEGRLATTEKIKDSIDQMVRAHKMDIKELETTMTESIANLQTEHGDENTEMVKSGNGKQKGLLQSLLGLDYSQLAGATVVVCPSSFEYIYETDQCLKVSADYRKAASMAEANCAHFSNRGRLAILDTTEKRNAVKTYLSNQGITTDILVGGFKDGNKYKWSNNKEIGQMGWCQNQPGESNRCVSLWAEKGFCLDDSPCVRKRYLCEVNMEEEEDYEAGR